MQVKGHEFLRARFVHNNQFYQSTNYKYAWYAWRLVTLIYSSFAGLNEHHTLIIFYYRPAAVKKSMQTTPLLSFINNANPVTLFVAGSWIQLLFTLYFPKAWSVLLAVVLLSANGIRHSMQANKKAPKQLPASNNVLPGRYKARIPREVGSSTAEGPSAQVVLFIVGITNNQ